MNLRTTILLGLVVCATSFGCVTQRKLKKDLKIENETLVAKWSAASGRLALAAKSSGRDFLKDIKLGDNGSAAKVTVVTDKTFGQGQAIEVSSNGNRAAVLLFPKLPFAIFRSTLAIPTSATAWNGAYTRNVQTASGLVNLGKPAAQLKTFGTGGLLAPDKNPGSYLWLAVVEPQSRNGVVFGWLTEDRGSGVLFSKVDGDAVRVDTRIDYGRLQIPPGQSAELETLAVGYFDDARIGLENYADAIAKVYNIHLPPQPVGYCTWYSQPHGGAADEEHLAGLAAFTAKELAPFGFSVVQIDDGWQAGFKRTSPSSPKKDFTTHNPNGPYPGGMKVTADKIKSLGLVPGIWFMPFAGTVQDPYFTNHMDWFVKTESGAPYDTPWGGTCLDITYAPAREHLRDVVSRICGEWGYQYIKIDGLWTGTATPQRYINSGYTNDNIGDAVFHDPTKSNIEAYRDGLKLVREAAGKNVFILGCNGPQNMRSYGGALGLVDGMRVGPDNKAEWGSLLRGPRFGTRHYFLNGRVWHNDPDPVYVRTNIPIKHAQLICSWVALSDQLNLSSEWLPGLPPERLDILKRTMPYHNATARPVDIFENDLPSVWLVSDTKHEPRRDVIGVFNWESTEKKFDYPLDRLGLDAKTEYVAFDYWQNKLIPSVKSRLQITLPAESCAVLAMRPVVNHPQVISTSRHVTQGMVDVLDEKWDDAAKGLGGRSKVIGGDVYELRIVTGDGSRAVRIYFSQKDKAAGVKGSFTQDGQLVRVKIESPTSRDVIWAVDFK